MVYTLRMLREAMGITQATIAAESGMYAPDVSKLEGKDSLDSVQLSTLRRYAAALGGTAELVIVVDGRRYRVQG